MAIQGINPVAPRQQQRVQRGGKLAAPLGALGGLVGGIVGGVTAGPGGALLGATKGFGAGAGAGSTLGSFIDPVRTKTVSQGPQFQGQLGGGGQSLAQKYKLSDAGRMALEGLQVAKSMPQFQEYQKPLALALLQDIANNNRQRIG